MRTADVSLRECESLLPSEASVEIVERKGLGHPDTICDAVMEHVSRTLCAAYLERFGRILHYNCDKGCLLAGRTEVRLGGGRVLEPMRLIVGDRASDALGSERIDVGAIASRAAADWFRAHLPRIDPERDVRIEVALRPGSPELVRLFEDPLAAPGANDTSAVVGYAPLTETEHLVLEAESYLNSAFIKARFPAAGEDVKVLGVRRGRDLEVTVALPLVDRYVRSEEAYFENRESIAKALREHLQGRLEKLAAVEVRMNALDQPGMGERGMYLTVLGTSAEHADSGAVGRGNDITGLWSLNRPQTGEAAAGKNPLSHTGKIYSVLAHEAAGMIYRNIPGVRAAMVWLASRIGEPVNQPSVAAVQVALAPGVAKADVFGKIQETVTTELSRAPALCEELIRGRHRLF